MGHPAQSGTSSKARISKDGKDHIRRERPTRYPVIALSKGFTGRIPLAELKTALVLRHPVTKTPPRSTSGNNTGPGTAIGDSVSQNDSSICWNPAEYDRRPSSPTKAPGDFENPGLHASSAGSRKRSYSPRISTTREWRTTDCQGALSVWNSSADFPKETRSFPIACFCTRKSSDPNTIWRRWTIRSGAI